MRGRRRGSILPVAVGDVGDCRGHRMPVILGKETRRPAKLQRSPESAFPDQVFMVHFITFTGRVGDWPDQIDRSIDINEWFDGKSICAKGRIEWYRDTPAINANYWYQYHIVR